MKRAKSSEESAEMPADKSAERSVARPSDAAPDFSIRAIYAEAMREVMADPRKAIAEHDPWLAVLLGYSPAPATSKG